MLVPDPPLVHEPPGRPPLLVGELLPDVADSLADLSLQQLELVVAVDADEVRVEPPACERRVVVVQVLTPIGVHDEQVLRAAVRQPVACRHQRRTDVFTGGEGKEEYLYSAFLHQGTHKALRHGSHSFTYK